MAVTSNVVLARMALKVIGAQSNIESITEDSEEAAAAELFLPQAIEETLEAFDWAFARKTESLNLSSHNPKNSWRYSYDEPADCIAPRRILSPLGRRAKYPPYERGIAGLNDDKVILCDIENAELQYTKRLITTALFSPLATTAVVQRLGFYMAPDILGEQGLQAQEIANKAFEITIVRAADSDGNQEKVEEDEDPDWIAER